MQKRTILFSFKANYSIPSYFLGGAGGSGSGVGKATLSINNFFSFCFSTVFFLSAKKNTGVIHIFNQQTQSFSMFFVFTVWLFISRFLTEVVYLLSSFPHSSHFYILISASTIPLNLTFTKLPLTTLKLKARDTFIVSCLSINVFPRLYFGPTVI